MAPQPFGHDFRGQKRLRQVVMASALLIFKNKKLLSLSFEILLCTDKFRLGLEIYILLNFMHKNFLDKYTCKL